MLIRSVDGVIMSPSGDSKAPQTQENGPPIYRRRTFTAPAVLQPKKRWWHKFLLPLMVLICMSASFLLASQVLGVALMVIYAIVAWVRRLPSKVSFLLAFLSLVTVIALLVIRQNVTLATNFSTYTFLLFIIAIISLMQESRANTRHKRSKIRR